MITIEDLRGQDFLKGLTDEQLTALVTLSNNSEQSAVDKRTGELHGQYDADILSLTGVAKNGTEKSYDYAKRVLGDYKAKIDELNGKITKLDEQIKNGSQDAELKKQLADSQNLVKQLQKSVKDGETALEKANSAHAEALLGLQVDNAFNAAVSGLKFKAGITEPIQKALLSAAKAEVLSRGKFEVQEANGVKSLIMRDSDSQILRNKNNNYQPYTVAELLMETSLKDAIDNGRKQSGGGTGANGGGGNGGVLDVSGARNQVEADDLIAKHLMSLGLTRDSSGYFEKFTQLRADSKVSELPLR